MTQKNLIEAIAKMRSLQRSFFATRNKEILGYLRPLEVAVLARLQENSESSDPTVWDLFEKCKALLINQAAWVVAKSHAAKLPEGSEARSKADQKATLLEGTCRKLERAVDKALDQLQRPTLPGLEDS